MLKLNEKEFWDKVNQLKEIDPENNLLEKICVGHDRFTELYLLNTLKAFVQPIKEKTEIKTAVLIASDSLGLVNQMNTLIAQKRKFSNKFWDIQTNTNACKELSIQILFYETQIEDLRDQIRYFNLYDHQRPEELTKKNELNQNSKYDLQKRLLSTRVMIAQVQKELDSLASLKDVAKIQSREKRLIELKNQRDDIANQLQEGAL